MLSYNQKFVLKTRFKVVFIKLENIGKFKIRDAPIPSISRAQGIALHIVLINTEKLIRPKDRFSLFCLFSFVSFIYFFFKVFSSSTARFCISPAIELLPTGQCETFNETSSRHRLMDRKLLLEIRQESL